MSGYDEGHDHSEFIDGCRAVPPADRVEEQSQPTPTDYETLFWANRHLTGTAAGAETAVLFWNEGYRAGAAPAAELQSRLTAAMERCGDLAEARLRAHVAESENKRLREALKLYGEHADWCHFAHSPTSGTVIVPCDCGLDAALSNTKKEGA